MKNLILPMAALLFSLQSYAQNADKALIRVKYAFSHIQDTTQRDKPHTETMLLIAGKNASLYTSYDKIMRNIEMEKSLKEQISNQAGGGSVSFKISGTGGPVNQLDYFYFAKENKFYTKERLINNYLIEEPVANINWKIEKDTASFSGIPCKKATGTFKGRNWVAWFAPGLPFQSGPWKLNGLPGLIIEAYDDKKEVLFNFDGIENVTAENTKADDPAMTSNTGLSATKIIGLESNVYLGAEIKLPADATKTTKKEMNKLKEARDKDPQGFYKTQLSSSLNGVTMRPGTEIRTNVSPTAIALPKQVVNNPIELSDQK